MLDRANRANVTFYSLDPRGLPTFDSQSGPERAPTGLREPA